MSLARVPMIRVLLPESGAAGWAVPWKTMLQDATAQGDMPCSGLGQLPLGRLWNG